MGHLELAYRFRDYENYISSRSELQKKSDTCLVVVCYNQIDLTLKLSAFLRSQCLSVTDVLVVDNCSSDGTYARLLEEYGDVFNIVQSKTNLGGAGGFAIGQEWVLTKGYEYCILTEEDAIPLDDDIVREMIKFKNTESIVKARYYESGSEAFTLHFTLYPTWTFSRIGVMNKDLFFRADDSEYENRLRSLSGIKKVVVDKYYSHPIVKQGFGLLANYFAFRNSFLVYSRTDRFRRVANIYFKGITYAFFTLLNDRNVGPLKQVTLGFYHYLTGDLSGNNDMVSKFRGSHLKPVGVVELRCLSFEEFFKRFNDYRIGNNLILTNHLLRKFNNRRTGKLYSGSIADKYNSPSRVLALWFRKVVFIEEIDFQKEVIVFLDHTVKRPMITRLFVLGSLCAAILSSSVIFPVIFVRALRIKSIWV